MQSEVEGHIRNLSDVELLEYIKHGVDVYTPEAIALAEQEFSRRGLSREQIGEIEAQVAKRESGRAERARQPLDTANRILLFLCGLFPFYGLVAVARHFGASGAVFLGLGLLAEILPVVLIVPSALRLSNEGCLRKSRETLSLWLAGIAMHGVLLTLRIPPWIGLYESLRSVQ
jgi:hypothetical protein